MIEKSILDKCHKVIEKYELDEYFVNDLISAICTVDMLHGTNDKKLDVGRFSVAVNGDFYGIHNPHYSDEAVKPLPDIQVLRVLADTLILGVGSKVSSDVKDLVLTNPASELIADNLGVSVKTSSTYLAESDCVKIIDTLANSISLEDYQVMITLIKELDTKSNEYMTFKNGRSVNLELKDLNLPLSIRHELRSCKAETMNFMEDAKFNDLLSNRGYSISDYCNYIKMYYLVSTIQNIVLKLEHLVHTNKPMFCTVCIQLKKVLDNNQMFHFCCNNPYKLAVITDGNCMKIKLYREYVQRLIDKSGVVALDNLDELLDIASQFVATMKRWCR